MTVWIVTTGSSDVQLKNTDNWNELSRKVRSELNNIKFSYSEADYEEYAKVPARVMGIVYAEQPDYYEDLVFPLLDNFCKQIEKDKPTKIILLLTDQSDFFSSVDKKLIECPYWQDTCTLKFIFEQYFKDKFPKAEQLCLYLKPQSGSKGLDHWNDTLTLVQETLSSREFDKKETIYISHQAGTPAISSAVQFVALGRFGKKVKFLVGNEYEKSEAEVIDSSTYLRGIQIQEAKRLIREGSPGAALKVLKGVDSDAKYPELEALVDIFNLNRSLTDGEDEFEIKPATQRIADALELIRIFFLQKNYLQGIALLAAAQETFLKVAILSKIKTINDVVSLKGRSVKVSDLVEWTPRGLFLSEDLSNQTLEFNKNILRLLSFPVEKFSFESEKDLEITNRNFGMLAWLCRLEATFTPWSLLKWSCSFRNTNDDLRNQLMHNLRGMEASEVSQYLLVNANPSDPTDVVKNYDDFVKVPFLRALELFDLSYSREKLYKKLQDIADRL
jgi:hypothetical protein